ncbi:hypothetical protein KEM52_006381 [Ascosphaera acerosa]|nr:hypothetical protein KEM52_006381 [Ascosphaera acerosa]
MAAEESGVVLSASCIAQGLPPGVALSSKDRKYDRQLRLWETTGQRALEASQVLLVTTTGPLDGGSGHRPGYPSGVAGVEALKNLVLPGIGGFTIVDHATVSTADLGVNFFVEADSVGRSRGGEVCRLLKELNPDVDGTWSSEFSLVLVSGPCPANVLEEVSLKAAESDVPLIYLHCAGFYGGLSLQLPAYYPVIETHPSPDVIRDLRLTNPWPELAQEAEDLRTGGGSWRRPLDDLDDFEHGHVPWVLLLIHYLNAWRASPEHAGPPSTYAEKLEFREMVRKGMRLDTPENGEENYEQACAAVLKYAASYTIPETLRDVLDHPLTLHPTPSTPSFYVIAHAIGRFLKAHGVLPQSGNLPDMKAKTSTYVRLQRLYRDKAYEDALEVGRIVSDLEDQWGRPISERVAKSEIDAFCKNAAFVRLIRGRKLPHLGTLSSDPPALTSSIAAASIAEVPGVADATSQENTPSVIDYSEPTPSDAPIISPVAGSAGSEMGDMGNGPTPSAPESTSESDNSAGTAAGSGRAMAMCHPNKAGVTPYHWCGKEATLRAIRQDLETAIDTQESVVPVYIALRALDAVVSHRHGRQPSNLTDSTGEAEPMHVTAVRRMYEDLRLETLDDDRQSLLERCIRAVDEAWRGQGGELHGTAALVGGMAAQEALKVMTRQYIPASGTVVYDGVTGRTGVLAV